jgi:hypothetical protein
LARDVVARARENAARSVAEEVEFVAGQLEQQHQAEAAVVAAPGRADEVVGELRQAEREANRLASSTATWQQTLADGIADLIDDVQHDLQSRLKTVLREVEEIIDRTDPQQTWTDTEAWLRRQVAMVSLANRDLLNERADDLTESVAAEFDLQAGSIATVRVGDGSQALDEVTLAPASTLVMPGGKLAPLMMAARTSFYLPMLVGSYIAGALTGPVVFAVIGFSMTLGVGIGRKIIADERKRQLTYRQQQAKAAVRRFVDDVAFVLNKQTRDGLRAAQRQLRDDFQARALILQRSATASVSAAHRASELDESERRTRRQELVAQDRRLGQLRAAARELATSAGTDG